MCDYTAIHKFIYLVSFRGTLTFVYLFEKYPKLTLQIVAVLVLFHLDARKSVTKCTTYYCKPVNRNWILIETEQDGAVLSNLTEKLDLSVDLFVYMVYVRGTVVEASAVC